MTEIERPKRVLFVCYENSNRSQMAEAFAPPTSPYAKPADVCRPPFHPQ